MNRNHKVKWPCESTHHVTFFLSMKSNRSTSRSLSRSYCQTNTTLKSIALPRKKGIIEIVLEKAHCNLWPEDIIHERFRWNAEELAPWTDPEQLKMHLLYQYRQDDLITDNPETDVMTKVRDIIRGIFGGVIHFGYDHIQLEVEGSTDSPDWFIRAHPPVRSSPHGTPILLLSVLDHHLQERLGSQGNWDISRSKKSFHRIYGHFTSKLVVPISRPKSPNCFATFSTSIRPKFAPRLGRLKICRKESPRAPGWPLLSGLFTGTL